MSVHLHPLALIIHFWHSLTSSLHFWHSLLFPWPLHQDQPWNLRGRSVNPAHRFHEMRTTALWTEHNLSQQEQETFWSRTLQGLNARDVLRLMNGEEFVSRFADGSVKLAGRDSVFRTSTLIQDHLARGEEHCFILLAESDRSPTSVRMSGAFPLSGGLITTLDVSLISRWNDHWTLMVAGFYRPWTSCTQFTVLNEKATRCFTSGSGRGKQKFKHIRPE